MLQNMIFLKNIKHLAHCCAHKGISSIGGSMISRFQRRCRRFFSQNKSAYRNTAAQSLGAGHNIRLYTVILPCKICSRTSHTALYLVKNQNQVFFIAKSSQPLQKSRICRINSAFPLNHLCENGAGFVCDLGFYTFQIIKIRKFHAADQWLKGFPVMSGPGNRKSSHAPSVEGMVHGNDLISLPVILRAGVFPGSLQRSLYGFCTAVCKKRPAHAAGFYKLFSCLAHRLIIIKV